MKKILFSLTFSCHDATLIMEKKLAVGLSKKESLKLWVHNSVCAYCRYYERQSKQLDKLLQRFTADHDNDTQTPENITDNKNLKEKILRKLND